MIESRRPTPPPPVEASSPAGTGEAIYTPQNLLEVARNVGEQLKAIQSPSMAEAGPKLELARTRKARQFRNPDTDEWYQPKPDIERTGFYLVNPAPEGSRRGGSEVDRIVGRIKPDDLASYPLPGGFGEAGPSETRQYVIVDQAGNITLVRKNSGLVENGQGFSRLHRAPGSRTDEEVRDTLDSGGVVSRTYTYSPPPPEGEQRTEVTEQTQFPLSDLGESALQKVEETLRAMQAVLGELDMSSSESVLAAWVMERGGHDFAVRQAVEKLRTEALEQDREVVFLRDYQDPDTRPF